MEQTNEITSRVLLIREAYHLNVSDFASKCGLSHVTVYRSEKNGNFSKKSLFRISETYKVPIDWIVTGQGSMFPDGKADLEDIEPKISSMAYVPWQKLLQSNLLLEREVQKIWQKIEALHTAIKNQS